MSTILGGVTAFLNWFYYTPVMEPFFNFLGGLLDCAPNAVKRYGAGAFEKNFYTALPYVLLIAVIIALIIAGVIYYKKKHNKKPFKPVTRVLMGVLVFLVLFVSTAGISGYQYVDNLFGLHHPGNAEQYEPQNIEYVGENPLEGKKILGVGSSVMMGYSAKCIGPGEDLAAATGCIYVKETNSGTSVTSTTGEVLDGGRTYLPRLMDHTAEEDFDMVIIQLGTNDCADWVVVGEPTDSLDRADMDEYTFCGAMESMIAYSQETWGEDCKVVIYSNTRFEDKNVEKYDEMVNQVQEIVDKWQAAGRPVYLMDMWNDADLNDPTLYTDEQKELYNFNEIHPRCAGYVEWWLPYWEEFLFSLYE